MGRKESIMEQQQTQLPIIEVEAILNFTPHKAGFFNMDDNTLLLEVEKEETPIRVESNSVITAYLKLGDIYIPQTETVYGEVIGLPEEKEGVKLIVSGMVRSALKEKGIIRNDILVPGMQFRNEAGQVVGCYALDK
jgi:hypothetical protein